MINSTLGRFKIISGYLPVLPHKCAVCGTSEKGDYFDFGLDLDYYGTVYICLMNCFREAANCIDYYSPAQHGLALERIEQLRDANNKLIDENEELRNALGSLDRAGVMGKHHFSPTPIITEESQSKPEFELSVEPTVDSGSEKAEPGPTKPTNEQRPTNVQRDDSLDEFIKDLDI
jgi:hypothetical protein